LRSLKREQVLPNGPRKRGVNKDSTAGPRTQGDISKEEAPHNHNVQKGGKQGDDKKDIAEEERGLLVDRREAPDWKAARLQVVLDKRQGQGEPSRRTCWEKRQRKGKNRRRAQPEESGTRIRK